eukprot:TRINITY_DN5388_c0_g1_i1.p1 TRINITY_DN5388_c0_g1~~TRINITY_DN5388_c0_g1_i1.p1  ORF type:complete len:1401 (+),score=326.79 TRINITY_DN5388_c0_g1_i1:64-4203(+)
MECDPAFVKEIDAKAARGDQLSQGAARCLQAMRSIICTNGCAGSSAAYFAASVAALQRQLSQKGGLEQGPEEDRAAALLLILRRALPSVSASVASSRLNDVVAALAPVFKAQTGESVTRQALLCLAIASEICYAAGGRPNRKVLKPIFSLLADSRKSVRHQAELSAISILKKAAAAPDQQTMEFATQHLVQMLETARPDKKGSEEIPAQRAVSLLRAVSKVLPAEHLGIIFEALAKLPALLGQHPCCTAAFEFVAEHFAQEEEEEEGEDDEAMQTETDTRGQAEKLPLALKLLPGLLSVPVTMLNVAYVSAFASALSAVAAVLCAQTNESLPKGATTQKIAAVKKLLSLFSERDPTLLKAAKEACLGLFKAAGTGGDCALLQELLEAVRPLLRFEAKGSWPHALPVVAGLFEALGAIRAETAPSEIQAWTLAYFERARPLVSELTQARDKARTAELTVFGKELSQCIGSAVSTFGPEQVLQVAPLQLLEHSLSDAGYEQKSRSWLLLILKDSVRRASLGFFAGTLLPVASSLKARASQAETGDAQVLSKKYLTLLEQVWSLLPGFCDEPLDMQGALLSQAGQFAKQLVAVLQNEPSLRDFVWAGFKNCCGTVLEPKSSLSSALQDQNRSCLQTLSGRVMPEMFNAFLKANAESEGQDASRVSHSRQLALAAVQGLAKLADPNFVGSMFKSLVTKWLKATSGDATASVSEVAPLGDLANALLPHLPVELLQLALKVFGPSLKGSAGGEEDDKGGAVASAQKVAYRAITNVIRHPEAGKQDVSEVLVLWGTLRDARQTCAAAALKQRLLAMQALLSLMETSLGPQCKNPAVKQEYVQCLTTLMPEVLFHLRDQSTAVRDAARECLHIAATTAIQQELQQEIVTLLSAGLAGLSRHSKAAALDALSRLIYEHHSKIAVELRSKLIGVVLLLLEDRDAQVWRAALKFTKVVVFVLPKEALIDQLPPLMKLFHSRHLASAKMLVRSIVERLVKVLPAETLEEVFPKDHLPLLQHVQKQLARQQRPKAVRDAKAGEGDGDEEPEEDPKASRRGSRKGSKAAGAAESYESFKAGDEGDNIDDDDDDMDGGSGKAARKRARGRDEGEGTTTAASSGNRKSREPPTSAVMAHGAVQALLDAWEAESDSEGGEKGGKRKTKRKRGEVSAASTWITEDQEVPVDFMSADAAHSVLTVRAPPSKRRKGTEVGNAGAENKIDSLRRSGLRFAEDGRLVVDEEKAEAEDENSKSGKFNVGTDSQTKPKALSQLAAQRRARAEAKARARSARKGSHIVKGLDTFKPGKKKAQGDARRKSKFEPYAYIRLNPKVTKEKFKSKATESFSKVVKGAKKGVLKGMKARVKDMKHKKAAEDKKRRKAKFNQKSHKPGSR